MGNWTVNVILNLKEIYHCAINFVIEVVQNIYIYKNIKKLTLYISYIFCWGANMGRPLAGVAGLL